MLRLRKTNPDQQHISLDGDDAKATIGGGGTGSYLRARKAAAVCSAQERRLAIPKWKGTPVDRARAQTLMFRLA